MILLVKTKQKKAYLKDVGTQTGADGVDIVYHLANNKSIRVYKSPVYKEMVVSFNISSSKSFIVNKQLWNQMSKLFPQIEKLLNK